MDDPTVARPVVCGVDGSGQALAAVRWAAQDARDRDLPLRLLAATGPLEGTGGPAPIGAADRTRRAGELAARNLQDAVVVAREILPADRITTAVAETSAVTALHQESARAHLLVLGDRGRGGFAELLAGSVAVGTAATARCPVVVLRGMHTPGGPVVVGVDGSGPSETALGVAFAEARLRRAPLVALHAWSDDVSDPYVGLLVDSEAALAAERCTLDEALARWTGAFGDVEVRSEMVRDGASRALVAASAGARLVVVGSRGRGGIAGLLLGSVGRVLLHHAHCPVLVARAG
ncbi:MULTISPECIES: universal stress protein [Pseudonocardia]|uniref:Universal stress protein n=2 Tax=Pseudonocardia TaxID=1847 RepID=A0A1Y2MSU2_PSEAH|nr:MULTISPECIES: universal stress protein [Pseudonocardia]OSY38276.1 Universal stress protein [Pseudonocardia autotrophica]TDN70998.1 nucleotide-binding universal stress UspA family protein [Pseudonocardia autotrophica]BBG01666.1 universal stress protein [Pseudonocardia autotrophica]GEC25411.1 universal stress protein [Pseudonocardia saturnea]